MKLMVLYLLSSLFLRLATPVMAQDNVVPDDPTVGQENQDEGAGAIQGSDWLWVIPVIGIPLLLYALTQTQRNDRDRSMMRDDRMVGSKGGEVTRKRDRDDMRMDE